jgi:hypothetical protein
MEFGPTPQCGKYLAADPSSTVMKNGSVLLAQGNILPTIARFVALESELSWLLNGD